MSGSQPVHLEQHSSMSTWPWKVSGWEFVPHSQHLWGTSGQHPMALTPGPSMSGPQLPPILGHRESMPVLLPLMASFTVESTGSMFFSTSSSGPGRRAIFSLRSSASRALFSFIWAAGRDLSAVEAKRGGGKEKDQLSNAMLFSICCICNQTLCHLVLYHPNNFLMQSSLFHMD